MTLREQLDAILDENAAAELEGLVDFTRSYAPAERWAALSDVICEKRFGFAATSTVWQHLFADEAARPMWFPSMSGDSNIERFLAQSSHDSYDDLYSWSVTEREAFWQTSIERVGVLFRNPPTRVLNTDNGNTNPVWLSDAMLNVVDSCFSAPDDSAAIVASTDDGQLETTSVAELRAEVLHVAGAIQRAGFEPGDRLAIIMPMIPESVSIYLGIVAAGCAVVSIADSFAATEIQTRLEISEAKAIFCVASFERAGRNIDLFSRVKEAGAPQAIVIGDTDLRDADIAWDEFLNGAQPLQETIAGPESTYVNILFSSGTTGTPKAIPWPQTVPMKCAIDGMWHHDIREGDVVVWPTNIGWMMGPWLIFASLMNKATIGLYHDAPVGEQFGQFVQDAKVTMLGVVPTLVRAWRASGCMERCDWSTVRCLSSTGEASSWEDMLYLSWLADFRPVIEYCGGTEVGGGYICSTVVQPNVPGCFSTPALGSAFVILDEEGSEADEGELFLEPPALGLSIELLNRDHNTTYYADSPPHPRGDGVLRRHGDYFERLPGNYYRAGGRADDTMNLGGIKVSSAEIERVLNLLDGVSETAAIAVSDQDGGPSRLVVFAVVDADCDRKALPKKMQTAIRSDLNPLFRIADVRFADNLPRTASNKVMRRKLRDNL